MGHTHGAGNEEAARQLAADVRAKWPTASILDWSNGEAEGDTIWGSIDGPCVGQLLDAEGEHLAVTTDDGLALQAIAMKHAKALGWHEAELDMQHWFYLAEARDVTDGENGWLEVGFKHPGWEFLYRESDNG